MKLTFQVSGGFAFFPGLSAPFTVDTATVAADRGAEIERLVAEVRAGVGHQAGAASGPAGPGGTGVPLGAGWAGVPGGTAGADQRTYTIAVLDDDGAHPLASATDPVGDPSLATLIGKLSELRTERQGQQG
jgi:hypothetical protein